MSSIGYCVVATTLLLGTCDPRPDCRTLLERYPAPGGAATIIVSHKVCTNYSSTLSVELATKTDQEERYAHTLLILDSPKIDGVPRKPQAIVQWENAEQVEVRYDTSVRMIFWGGGQVGSVRVIYTPIK